MPLLEIQNAIGRLVRMPDRGDPLRKLDPSEQAVVRTVAESTGFQFTVGVQRSWCVTRTTNAAIFTLSVLPQELRSQLIEEWMNAGGGVSSFYAAEADALLSYIATRLPNPSHELTVCRLEQATLRAHDGRLRFSAPDPACLELPDCMLNRARHAATVTFHGQPQTILTALEQHRTPPPISSETTVMLFAPGLAGLCRPASPVEVALWQQLARPASYVHLREEGHTHELIARLLGSGVLEIQNTGD